MGNLITILVKDVRMLSFLGFALLDVSLIGSFLASFFNQEGLSFMQVSAVLSAKNVVRVLSDVPFGILADIIGLKRILFVSRFTRIVSLCIMLISANKWMAYLSMILYGLSMSSIYGKIDGYIYYYLLGKDKKSSFPKIVSSYYLVVNILVVCAGLMSTYLFAFVGYRGLIVLTICASLLSFVFWALMPSPTIISANRKKKTTFFMRSDGYHVQKKVVLMATLNLLMWGCNTVFSISLLSYGIKPQTVSLLTTLHFLCIAVGYLLAGYFHPRLQAKLYNNVVVATFILFAAMLPFFNIFTLFFFYLFTITIPLLKSVHEALFYESVRAEVGNSVFSFSTLLASCFTIYLNLIYPFFIKFCSFGWAMFFSFLPILLFTVLCSND